MAADNVRDLFLSQVIESLHVLSEDITLDDLVVISSEIEEPEPVLPNKKVKTNPFSWFCSSTSDLQSTNVIQYSDTSLRGKINREIHQ